MKPFVLTLFSFLLSLPLLSMPTAEEIAAAEPLVQEVMKAEMDALRSGKKTREQVGDAAVALAKAAQAPAEKYILLTGAFDYYMRGGAYDKAASALEAVRKAIPDWKGSDEFALIDKAMRVVAFGKGGPVRERYEELKERQQYASRLKKALAQAKAKPSDKKLQFQVATYSAALDRWPQAVDAFLAANNPVCAAAAKLEKESAPPAKIADAWWSVVDIRPTFLSSAIRAHAVDLYKKALASNSLAGLPRIAAENRIAEVESAATESVSEPIAASYGSKKNPYVTKGLVAMWDGEWNVGFGRHDGKSREWKDIVGKSDCKSIGSPSFSNKATVLDGNSFWEINPSPELLNAVQSAAVTCEIALKFDKDASAINGGFVGFGKTDSRVLWGYVGGRPFGSNAVMVFQHKSSPATQGWKVNTSLDELHTVVISSHDAEVLGWIDAKVCLKTKTAVATSPLPCYIGRIDGWANMKGSIYCVRIYNRALDERELQSNQAIDKKRFQ